MDFTKENIAGLTLTADKSDAIYFADDLPGFGIRLRSGGRRSWIVQYRAGGRQRRETLGDARRLTLKAARAAAEKRFAQIALGGDPQAGKAAARARAAVTVGPLVDRYLKVKQPVVRLNTFVADERYLRVYWSPLHALPMHTVERRLVAARLGHITTEHGVTAAARARQSLSAFFAWAIREGIAEANPVIGSNNPGAQLRARDRVLTDEELRAIWRACREDDFGRIVRLLMLTGARRDEIGGLRWSEIDVDRGILNIPGGERTKNHHPLNLVLPEAALSIVRSVPKRGRPRSAVRRGEGPFSAWSYSISLFGISNRKSRRAQADRGLAHP